MQKVNDPGGVTKAKKVTGAADNSKSGGGLHYGAMPSTLQTSEMPNEQAGGNHRVNNHPVGATHGYKM